MTRIEVDTTEVRFAASQLQDAAEMLGAATHSVPESVDAGEGSQPIADVLGRISQWTGLLAGVHSDIAGLLEDIAARVIDDEETVSEALEGISSELGDS
ncbi:hypothetical protein [Microbacterium sp. MYb62]|uniref:hypothetical protein n=1 Tax=Microbacterium sp. MYb62 TaxID=1848690 RepID=UPI000CFC1143|nr:hypothetical protein [Microbacterium sp. MYb62]PRB09944.1 hypothetical protein CQ042_18645 [Microbacterium sp. MYb62]